MKTLYTGTVMGNEGIDTIQKYSDKIIDLNKSSNINLEDKPDGTIFKFTSELEVKKCPLGKYNVIRVYGKYKDKPFSGTTSDEYRWDKNVNIDHDIIKATIYFYVNKQWSTDDCSIGVLLIVSE